MTNEFPIRILTALPLLCLTLISLAVAFGINAYVYPGHGRITFFSAVMSSFAIYSAFDMLRKPHTLLFVLIYVAVHVAVCFIDRLSDDSYYGVVLIPLAIVDYIGFVYGLYFIWKSTV